MKSLKFPHVCVLIKISTERITFPKKFKNVSNVQSRELRSLMRRIVFFHVQWWITKSLWFIYNRSGFVFASLFIQLNQKTNKQTNKPIRDGLKIVMSSSCSRTRQTNSYNTPKLKQTNMNMMSDWTMIWNLILQKSLFTLFSIFFLIKVLFLQLQWSDFPAVIIKPNFVITIKERNGEITVWNVGWETSGGRVMDS